MTVPKQDTAAAKKSGLHSLKQGDVLFNDGDPAQSLYIIQKGQLRLFKPKGKGFIEIAVLRAGEVIGEMAYFDDDGSGGKRSCSAQAQIPTEIIEISFGAFSKTMESLNPWFKTIINTLAGRLRKMNARVKELESNSVAGGYGGGKSEYEFLRTQDIIRSLSVIYLVFKSSGEKHQDGVGVHMNTLRFYAIDIFNVIEAKFDAFLELLKAQGHLKFLADKDKQLKFLVLKDIEMVRFLLVFFNTQRTLVDEKKLKINFRCENWLEKICGVILPLNVQDTHYNLNLNPILNEAKAVNRPLDIDDLQDARLAGFLEEIIVDKENELTVNVAWEKLSKTMPAIRMMNGLKRFNESQSGSNKY
ncbi:MAG: Crp/Fnr family transcriptional regulator [Bacteriovoracaceae bacterium]